MSANFWNNSALEPKRQFRFLVTLSLDNNDVQFLAKAVSRPTYTVDALQPNAADLLYKHLSTIGYQNPTSLSAATSTTITKKTATDAFSTFRIDEKGTNDDGTTKPIGSWKLQNAFITEVAFGEHSYDSEDMIDITLSIQYDWAQYHVGPYVAAG